MDLLIMLDKEDDEGQCLTAGDLIALGYYQVSAKYRHLAKLPVGKTGIQALIDAERTRGQRVQDPERWANMMGEGHAGDQYLRTYARSDGNVLVVPIHIFKEFKAKGGGTYFGKHWHTGVVSTQPGCPIDGLVLRLVSENHYECSDGHVIQVSSRQ
jgi:hypothetical protein